jgi:hypothetical protein
MIGGCSAGASTAMKRVGMTTLALWMALTRARLPAVQSAPRLALELQDYAALPITAENTDANTRAQLARVNFLRDEPNGRRFFVNDLNGPLYLLDKQTSGEYLRLEAHGVYWSSTESTTSARTDSRLAATRTARSCGRSRCAA